VVRRAPALNIPLSRVLDMKFHMDGTYLGLPHLDGCTIDGETQIALQPYRGVDPEDAVLFRSVLTVGPDGEYKGAVHSETTVETTWACPGLTTHATDRAEIHLYIQGSLVDGGRRMQGEMPPDISSSETLTGSWDFARQ
jgi:hypothetical protein